MEQPKETHLFNFNCKHAWDYKNHKCKLCNRNQRRERCYNCGELDYDLQNVYNFKEPNGLEEYKKLKEISDNYDIMDYLDKSYHERYCESCFEDVEH